MTSTLWSVSEQTARNRNKTWLYLGRGFEGVDQIYDLSAHLVASALRLTRLKPPLSIIDSIIFRINDLKPMKYLKTVKLPFRNSHFTKLESNVKHQMINQISECCWLILFLIGSLISSTSYIYLPSGKITKQKKTCASGRFMSLFHPPKELCSISTWASFFVCISWVRLHSPRVPLCTRLPRSLCALFLSVFRLFVHKPLRD